MQGALMQSSQTSGYFLTRAPLDMLTDHPIQWPFQVLAPFIACQSEQSLPPKFSLHLCVYQRPGVDQGDVAVRNAPITCPLPFVAIGDVKFQVQHVGLEGLERTRDHLPPVLGFLQGIQGKIPASPEEVLLAFIKAMKNLPHGVQMLHDDGITRIWLVLAHVKDDINRSGALQA